MIWTKEEISIADELMEIAPKLRDEFLDYHKDFHTTFKGGISYAAANPLTILTDEEKSIWKVEGLRYVCRDQKVERNMFLDPKVSKVFPTATALTKKYLDYCGCSGYSVLEPGGVIHSHSDIENTSHSTIRIHIPLIIPEGDVCLETGGVKNDWSDLFAFDNGELHSAYNKTNKRRLIYIIDIARSFLSIPSWGLKITSISIPKV
jgi:hypothetical protein